MTDTPTPSRRLLDCHGKVSWQQLADTVDVFGHEYVRNRPASGDCLLDGDMRVLELEDGLLLYRTQVVDQCDIRTSNVLHPSLKLLVLLGGRMQVRYGAQWLDLDATHAPRGLLVNLAQSDIFMRQWQRGRQERKLLISCSPQWLQRKQLHSLPFVQRHLALMRWQPSRKAMALAEQLHHEADQHALAHPLQYLSWQAKAQALLAEALACTQLQERGAESMDTLQAQPSATVEQTLGAKGTLAGLSVQAYRTLVALREWLATPASDGMGLVQIARHAGLSVAYLRRHFAAVAHGQSVMEFVRARRLQRACQALEREGVSVARAAEVAGYRSVTHFAKAFREAYGRAPSQWRSGA